jgi:hypothetical protein
MNRKDRFIMNIKKDSIRKKCISCIFCDLKEYIIDEKKQICICRKNSPIPVVSNRDSVDNGDYDETVWPYVDENDWCGEWKGSAKNCKLIHRSMSIRTRNCLIKAGFNTDDKIIELANNINYEQILVGYAYFGLKSITEFGYIFSDIIENGEPA